MNKKHINAVNKKKNVIPEARVVKSILQYYALFPHKIKLWRNNTGATKTASGGWITFGLKNSPDIIGYIATTGRFVGIECKGEGKKIEPGQRAFLDDINAKGGLGIAAWSLEDVQEALKEAWDEY